MATEGLDPWGAIEGSDPWWSGEGLDRWGAAEGSESGLAPANRALTSAQWPPPLLDPDSGNAFDTSFPETGSWVTLESDFAPVQDGFALEFRAETIELLTEGDALRRGETELTEVGRSHSNADVVGGRDQVNVDESLHEQTGGSLTVDGAYVESRIDGDLDVHADVQDVVRLLGNAKDTWNGGLTALAAQCMDMAVGGSVCSTAPLHVSVAGLSSTSEKPGVAMADGLMVEFYGTLFEREYASAVNAAGVGAFGGTLYCTLRPGFYPLMKVAMGVRNLIAGAGDGRDDGSRASSPPPASEGSDTASIASNDTILSGSSGSTAPDAGGAAVDLSSGTTSGVTP